MDGLLKDPNPHETDPIPAEFPVVGFDAYLDEEVSTPQEMAGNNAVADSASANAGILHGNPTADDDKDEEDDIEEVDMPQNEPKEIINVDVGSDGEQKQEGQDENPVDTSSQNQDNVPNTTYIPVITDVDDTAYDRTAEDNPNGAVEVEDVEKDDDGDDASDNKDEDDSTKGVYNRCPRRNRKKIDTYEPSLWGQQYSYQSNPMFIQTKGYNAMSEN